MKSGTLAGQALREVALRFPAIFAAHAEKVRHFIDSAVLQGSGAAGERRHEERGDSRDDGAAESENDDEAALLEKSRSPSPRAGRGGKGSRKRVGDPGEPRELQRAAFKLLVSDLLGAARESRDDEAQALVEERCKALQARLVREVRKAGGGPALRGAAACGLLRLAKRRGGGGLGHLLEPRQWHALAWVVQDPDDDVRRKFIHRLAEAVEVESRPPPCRAPRTVPCFPPFN